MGERMPSIARAWREAVGWSGRVPRARAAEVAAQNLHLSRQSRGKVQSAARAYCSLRSARGAAVPVSCERPEGDCSGAPGSTGPPLVTFSALRGLSGPNISWDSDSVPPQAVCVPPHRGTGPLVHRRASKTADVRTFVVDG